MTAEVQLPVQMTDTAKIHRTPAVSAMQTQISSDRSQTDSPPTVITVRMIMQGKEVGMIIGKKGDNVKRYREESGAKINISDASCPERIVTVTGAANQLNKAFDLICTKFDDIREMHTQTNPGAILPPMSFKLVIPASQCGSLIGKGGNKIKEIREISGASVQVATDMLPGSTERTVTVSGSSTAITRCLQEICAVMLESPPKGATIPYRPKTAIQAPLMYAAAVGAAAQAAYTLPNMHPMAAAVNMQPQAGHILHQQSPTGQTPQTAAATSEQQRQPQPSPMVSTATAVASASPYPHPSQLAQLQASHQGTPLILPQSSAASASQIPYGSLINPAAALGMVSGLGAMGAYLNRPFAGGYMAASPATQQQTQSTEMVIPNELIGCVIGRGGAKINEIRQLSGAQIKISNCEEGNADRKVTITGFPETISMAAYLINTSIELHKNQLLNTDANTLNSTAASQQTPLQSSMAATMLPTAVSPSYSKPLSVYPYNTSGIYGLGANPLAGLAGFATAAYDPKALLNASKLKVLPSNSVIKQEHRFAPY